MPTRRFSGTATAASDPDNGGDHSGGGGGGGGTYVDDVFSTYLYEGNGGTQTITNGIDLAGEGGMVWLKVRSANGSNNLFDTESGPLNFLVSNAVNALDSPGDLSAFNSNGFSLNLVNGSGNQGGGYDYASWTFRKAKNFFDVVTYTGDGSSSNQIPHSLGIRPGMIIVKRTDSSGDWSVLARYDTRSGQYRYSGGKASAPFGLNNTNSIETTNTEADRNVTGEHFDAAKISGPLSSTQADVDQTNQSGGQYVAYVFAHDDSDESMIKCGSYTGNGSEDGPEIDLGFEPQWVMIKAATVAGDWSMVDTMRGQGVDSSTSQKFAANTSREERSSNFIRLTSTGFKLSAAVADINGSGNKFIYMAIRRPNKPADEFEADDVFAIDTMGSTGDGKAPAFRSDLPIDMAIRSDTSGASHEIASRLTSGSWLKTDTNAAESSINDLADFDFQNGWSNTGMTASNYISHMFRRAPGFFDVVAYEGNNSSQTIPHNLTVTPEMAWFKVRTTGGHNTSADRVWNVMHKDAPAAVGGNVGPEAFGLYASALNDNKAFVRKTIVTEFWEDRFTLGSDKSVNAAGNTYIAYLFASVPGISKVGSYTGNGSEVEVDCGFTTGARWVLIKAASHTGDWLMTVPTSALNFTVALNNTDAQQGVYGLTATPNGFKATHALTNTDGVEYIFYAIA